MSILTLARYAGSPLPDDQLLAALGLARDDSLTWLVATTAQQLQRRGLAPPHQRGPGEDEVALVFHAYLRRQLPEPPLTRSEERVILQRAAARLERDATLRRQLRHDVLAWREALAELAARGIELDSGSTTMHDTCVDRLIADLLRELQRETRAEQRRHGRASFETIARDWLEHGWQPTPDVVLEGFTFLTPLQELLVDRALALGARVTVVSPAAGGQPHGLAILERTWRRWHAGTATVALPAAPPAVRSALATLQQGLFADEPSSAAAPDDGTLAIAAYRTRHEEVRACLDQVQALLAREGWQPDDLAIVARHSADYRTIIHEEADLRGIGQLFDIPPRKLLLTPLGQFVLTLYAVWRDGALRMSAEEFETLLVSGWLGQRVRASVAAFGAIRAQYASRCEDEPSWRAAFDALERALATPPPAWSRLPIAAVDAEALASWRAALDTVIALCRRLFDTPEGSIGAHVTRLLHELHGLADDGLAGVERDVVERVRLALGEVADAGSIAMTTTEFGEVLNGLVRDYERAEAEAERPLPAGRVWITTPEGIDGYHKRGVFVLGVDDQRFPAGYRDPWPFAAGPEEIAAHVERERYLFLAMLRAAGERGWLSWTNEDLQGRYRPSPYLREAGELLGRALPKPAPHTAPAAPPAEDERPRPPRVRRDRYDLAEVAHFALCPYRYKHERLNPAARLVRDRFQLRFLAEGIWLAAILDRLVASGETLRGWQKIRQRMIALLDATCGEVQAACPGLRPLDWLTIEEYVTRDIEFLTKRMKTYPITVLPGWEASYVVSGAAGNAVVDATVSHRFRHGDFVRPIWSVRFRHEWQRPQPRPEEADDQRRSLGDIHVFAHKYHAHVWWQDAVRHAFYERSTSGQNNQRERQAKVEYRQTAAAVHGWLQLIEAGHYPKHPGEHCRTCPLNGECLGI